MPEKNLFCLNIMINGHVKDSDYEEALSLFNEMLLDQLQSTSVFRLASAFAELHVPLC